METRNPVSNTVPTLPIRKWRDIPLQQMHEGQLTGHLFALDLMKRARNPEFSRQHIDDALRKAMADQFAGADPDGCSKVWAAISFIYDMVDLLAIAAAQVDLDEHFGPLIDEHHRRIELMAETAAAPSAQVIPFRPRAAVGG
ncbi:MAG: hypothetical protein JWP29_4840 [Rhodoferax sp.]|nr:hypothetical protein [Rhodoferax sp.]